MRARLRGDGIRWISLLSAGTGDVFCETGLLLITTAINVRRSGLPGWLAGLPCLAGHPVSAHYGLEYPAAVVGEDAEVERAFRQTLKDLMARRGLLAQLRLHGLDRLALMARLQAIPDQARE